MLIEQTTEFQLKRPGPFGRTCTPITGKLQRLNKNLKRKSSRGLFTAKVLQEAMYLTSPYRPNHLQLIFYSIMPDSKRVLGFNCKKRIEQLNFFDWL